MTVRKIERGEPVAIRNKTKVQLEHALLWGDGLVDKILAGTATDEELSVKVHRKTGGGAAVVGGGDAKVNGVRQVGNLTEHQRAEQLAHLDTLDDDRAIFTLANRLVPLLARRSPSSPASRAAVTNLLDVMKELVDPLAQDGDET